MDKGALKSFMRNACLLSTVYTKQQINQQKELLELQRKRWNMWKEILHYMMSMIIGILYIPAIPIICMVMLNWVAQMLFMSTQSFSAGKLVVLKVFGICEMAELPLDYFPFYYTTLYAKAVCSAIP